MASYQHNIAIIGDYAPTANALALTHDSRITEGVIDAVWIGDHFASVDSIEFADYVSAADDDGLTAADHIAMYG